MKRILTVIVMAIALLSCQKEGTTARSTTYTFIDTTNSRTIPGEAGIEGDVVVEVGIREYNSDGHNIKTNLISPCAYATEYKFTAAENTEYVTVRYKVSIKESSYTFTRWIANVIYLNKLDDTRIAMNGETIVQPSEPK